MGGHISVTSEVAKGTTFSILFPVVDGVEQFHTTSTAIDPKDDFNMSILLVDDDSIRLATETVLTSRGFTVSSASDGKEALDLFKANPTKYGLILTDLSMPRMSGVELTKEIGNSNFAGSILLSTGHLGSEEEEIY